MPINLEINGQPVTVDNGATVMDAATKLGIFVPHFCYHKKLSIAANCRMCLVQVEKAPKPLPACATPATEGMKALTHTEFAKTAQQGLHAPRSRLSGSALPVRQRKRVAEIPEMPETSNP